MKRDREARWDLISPVDTISVRARNDLSGLRLDNFMVRRFPWRSRTGWAEQIKQGKVVVDGEKAKPSQKVREGQVITAECSGKKEEYIDPATIPLEVIWENEDCLAINKEAGRAVHPVGKTLYGTCLSALVARYLDNPLVKPTLVHRLDRETSGVLLVAKNSASASRLAIQFERREVKKYYHAIVSGKPEPEEDLIDAPIGHAGGYIRLQRAVKADGQAASTSYKVLRSSSEESDGIYSLVQCSPHTGRTHQIRVHMSHIGCPIVGDWLYGSTIEASRFMLHASRLLINAPDGSPLKLFAPHPPEFREALTLIR